MPAERRTSGPPRALTIAGSDSGGGAGIQADLKTFALFGVWGMSAVTSVTVQNTEGVSDVADLPAAIVAEQIRAVASDIGVDAAKTGMLSSTDIIEAVAEAIEDAGIRNLVVDPVFVSKHGDALLRQEAVDTLKKLIVPMAEVVTPNLLEASGLAGFEVASRDDMEEAARAMLDLGAKAVLVKGGHLSDAGADDLFAAGGRFEWLRGERIEVRHTHGTGCVLSAAIAAGLARGTALEAAVREAKAFVTEAIRHGLALGHGIGPVHPGWSLSRDPR